MQTATRINPPTLFTFELTFYNVVWELKLMDTNAIHIPPASEPDLLARARPFEPDPPAIDGMSLANAAHTTKAETAQFGCGYAAL